MTDYTTMNKMQLREACKAAGIRNASRMTNDCMREALLRAQNPITLTVPVEAVYDRKTGAVTDFKLARDVPGGTVDYAAIAAACRLPEGVLFPQSSPQDQTDAERFVKLSQRVINNTPPRNRKGRSVPSRFRTAGRLRRFEDRQALQR